MTKQAEEQRKMLVKRTIKDSVFTSLFKDKKYLIQLYQALHPEDTKTTEADLKDVTVSNVLVDDIYNDLGFMVGTTTRPEELSLSEEFFDGKDICLDVKVKMIYDGKKGDIINQYVIFTKVCNEQIAIHGRTRKAVQESIRICKDRNVLKEYLSSREQEVVDMLMELYDEEEVLRSYVECEKYDKMNEIAKRLLKLRKLSVEEIAEASGLTVEAVEKLSDN